MDVIGSKGSGHLIASDEVNGTNVRDETWAGRSTQW